MQALSLINVCFGPEHGACTSNSSIDLNLLPQTMHSQPSGRTDCRAGATKAAHWKFFSSFMVSNPSDLTRRTLSVQPFVQEYKPYQMLANRPDSVERRMVKCADA